MKKYLNRLVALLLIPSLVLTEVEGLAAASFLNYPLSPGGWERVGVRGGFIASTLFTEQAIVSYLYCFRIDLLEGAPGRILSTLSKLLEVYRHSRASSETGSAGRKIMQKKVDSAIGTSTAEPIHYQASDIPLEVLLQIIIFDELCQVVGIPSYRFPDHIPYLQTGVVVRSKDPLVKSLRDLAAGAVAKLDLSVKSRGSDSNIVYLGRLTEEIVSQIIDASKNAAASTSPTAPFKLVVELGGHHIRTAILDAFGKVLRRADALPPRDRSGDLLKAVEGTIQQVIEQSGVQSKDLAAVGIATPGELHPNDGSELEGSIIRAFNLPLTGVHLRREIENIVAAIIGRRLPVHVFNDLRAAARAEEDESGVPFVYLNLGSGLNAATAFADRIVNHELGGIPASKSKSLEARYQSLIRLKGEWERAAAYARWIAGPLKKILEENTVRQVIIGGGEARRTPAFVKKLNKRLRSLGYATTIKMSGMNEEYRGLRGVFLLTPDSSRPPAAAPSPLFRAA